MCVWTGQAWKQTLSRANLALQDWWKFRPENGINEQHKCRTLGASFMLIRIGLGDWWFFQWLLCLLYVLCPAVACVKVCWRVSEALMLAMCSVVFMPVYSLFRCFRSSHTCHMCLILFLPVQSLLMHVFQKLSYLLCGLCLSLSSLTLPQTVRLFNISLCSQAPQQQYTVLSFSSMRRHGHSHKLTSSRALRYYTVGIPFSDA